MRTAGCSPYKLVISLIFVVSFLYTFLVGELGERGGRGAVGVRPEEDSKERLDRRRVWPSGERYILHFVHYETSLNTKPPPPLGRLF